MIKKAWLTSSILSLVLVYAVLYVWQPGGVRMLNIVTDALLVFFALLASFLAVKASRMFEPGAAARRAWLLFGSGMAAMTAAELVWAYYHVVLDQPSPFPSPADLLWAISYVPILAGLVLQYRTLGVQATRRRQLGVAALYLSVLIVALAIAVWPALSEPGQSTPLDLLFSVFYLTGDMIIAFIATLSLLFLWNGLVSKPWQYIVSSVLLFVCADLLFSYGTANDLYATGSNLLSGVVDACYIAAYVLAAAGGYRQLTLRLPA